MARFVIVPQWQGSPSSRAMQLVDGAQAIAGDLPRASSTLIEVALEAGEALETGVLRFSALARTRDAVAEATAGEDPSVIVIGGDCGVSIGAIASALARDPSLAVVWFDAHPDLHTPETSISGAFGGMALSAVLGEGADGLALPSGGIPADRILLAGARDYETDEEARVAELGIRAIDVADLDPETLASAVSATGASGVYIHVDLDVLDPSVLTGVTGAVPFGLTLTQLLGAISAVRAAVPLAGATIAGFAPASPDAAADDLGTILRIVGALA